MACAAWLGGSAAPANAQSALQATEVDVHRLPPEARLTLRPEQGLEALAAKVARVLSLRTGAHVEVGENPPPGLLEAVPAGHVALARENGQVHLVLGAAFGGSFEATVQLEGGATESDVRSVALAVEALRDRAIEARSKLENEQELERAAADGGRPEASAVPVAEPAPMSTAANGTPRDDGMETLPPLADKRLKPVRPFVFLQWYSGASSQSNLPRMGVGGGGGLCVLGHCLMLAVEYPIPVGFSNGGQDIRYRYTTFTSSFYTRPWTFGRFTPGASVGFLTRLGYFERDMGLSQHGGLDTDLGVRGTLEGGYELFHAVDLLAELGLDYALDRYRLGHGDVVAYRGERATPWLQAGIRVRAD